MLTFLWGNAALRQYWIVWLMGFIRVVFKNEFAKNKLQMRYRRLHAYRVLVLSQTKLALASVATKKLFVSSPDVAIEVNVHVLQLQRKIVKK